MLTEGLEGLLPIVYAPMVGRAASSSAAYFRRPLWAVALSRQHQGKLDGVQVAEALARLLVGDLGDVEAARASA